MNEHEHIQYRQKCRWYVKATRCERIIRRTVGRLFGDRYNNWFDRHSGTCALMCDTYLCNEYHCPRLHLTEQDDRS